MHPSTHAAACERRRLATGEFALVELCSCGTVHVTIGAITLRLHGDALGEVARVLGDGARELSMHELMTMHACRRPKVLS